MLINGVFTTNSSIIWDNVVSFYRDLSIVYEVAKDLDFSLVSKIIPSLISNEENGFLLVIPTDAKVKETIFSLDTNSAPSPNGFLAFFSQYTRFY